MKTPSTLLLALALWVLLSTKPSLTVFVSIDCGSSESFTDENNIKWTGDDAYIQHGVSQQVYIGSSPLSTLREFPTRKKNCYSIKVRKGEKVLTRASFYYGNYDSKLSPPVFDLQFDGNYWATVNTSSVYYVDYEVIYVTKGNFTSICVAQTKPNQIPFISSLEVRSLDPTMYSHVDSNHALHLQWRYAFGRNQTIRYPDDAFDRIWTAAYGILLSEVKSEVSDIDISTTEDHPPQAALHNAIVSSGNEEYIQFINRLPAKALPVYIATYFSEVQASALGKRSIQMYIDNKPFSSPIVPPVGSVKEVYITNMTASADTTFTLQATSTSTLPPILNALEVYTISDGLTAGTDTRDVPPVGSVKEVYITNMTASADTTFTLQATSTSTLPPILNALEVYTISDGLTAGTDTRDVEGLLQLQFAFEVLVEWSGDPCLPYPYNWDWIECTTDATPRVTALYLSGYDLQGTLPDFSSMTALETIDLHNNTIEGPILDFLGLLPNLKTLNLSYNRFNGSVPASLKNKNIKIDTTNNCLSGMKCQPLSDSPSKLPSPPPPQLVSGDEPNNPPPPPLDLIAGDDSQGVGRSGSVKYNKLNMLFIVAAHTLLSLLFMKFV